jgi:hypothetical protein
MLNAILGLWIPRSREGARPGMTKRKKGRLSKQAAQV